MPLFREKPREVDAHRFGGDLQALAAWVGESYAECYQFADGEWHLRHRWGSLALQVGDWVIRGRDGFTACEPDEFERRHDAVGVTP